MIQFGSQLFSIFFSWDLNFNCPWCIYLQSLSLYSVFSVPLQCLFWACWAEDAKLYIPCFPEYEFFLLDFQVSLTESSGPDVFCQFVVSCRGFSRSRMYLLGWESFIVLHGPPWECNVYHYVTRHIGLCDLLSSDNC